MPIATDAQVQNYVDTRVRPRCEQIRDLLLACKDDIATIADVYSALTQPTPTWSDSRTNNPPPHLLAPSDVLAWNTFISRFVDFCNAALTSGNMNDGGAQYPIVGKACVRPPV